MAQKPVIQKSRKRVENAKKPAAYWRTTSPRKTLCPRPNAGLSGSMKQNAEEAKREWQRGCRRIIATLVGLPSRETIQAVEALSRRPRGPKDMSTENLEIIPKNGCSTLCAASRERNRPIHFDRSRRSFCNVLVIQALGTVESPRFGGGPSTEK